MPTQPLDHVSLGVFFLAACAAALIAIEAGYRAGRWRHAHAVDERDQPVGAMVASILGLLALVLGFTFNLAAIRFDSRRQVVLEEANAIGTTYLRTRLLPEPYRSSLAAQLREYVDVRISGVRDRKIDAALLRSEELHELMWSQAAAAAEQNPESLMTALFIQSLNNVIDLHAKRIFTGIRSRIPFVLWLVLFGLAMLGIASTGYQAGLSTTRRSPAMSVLVFSFVFVIYLIADLDRPTAGLLQVDQRAMLDLQRTMHAGDAAADHSHGN